MKTPWEVISKKCLPWHENSILFFENSSEKFFVKLHWQTRHVFNKFLKIMWKHDKRMKIESHISKCELQHSALLWLYCKWANVASLLCRNLSGPDSLIFYFTTWCPDTCKENFVSAAIPKNAFLNEQPSKWTTLSIWEAFLVRAVVTALIICLNTKKERVIKAHWWLDLCVA